MSTINRISSLGGMAMAASLLPACYSGLPARATDEVGEGTETSGGSSASADDTGGGENDGGTEIDPHASTPLAFPDIPGVPVTGLFESADGPVELTYTLLDNGYGVYEGDIILFEPAPRNLPSTQDITGATPSQRGFVNNTLGERWPNRVIPWAYDQTNPPTQTQVMPHQDLIQQAMMEIENHPDINVTFVPYNPAVHDDWIAIRELQNTCGSPVGRQGGRQFVTLGTGCYGAQHNDHVTAMHELSHAIGVWHEQGNPLRAGWISVHLDNVLPGKEHNFDIDPGDPIGPYNMDSIMHYDSCAFSICRDPMRGNAPCETLTTPPLPCRYNNRRNGGCTHCDCDTQDPQDPTSMVCTYPTILTLSGDYIFPPDTALTDTDAAAIDYALGCPGGDNGHYCGGPVGLDSGRLYDCQDGIYTEVESCAPQGVCRVEAAGAPDWCDDTLDVCPSGFDGWYCGQAVGLDEDTLYWCENGIWSVVNPTPVVCMDDNMNPAQCVLAPSGFHDHCVGENPPPEPSDPGQDCASGPCCNNGNIDPEGAVCQTNAETQYGCPWGTNAGADVGVQARDRLCSGTSSQCDGAYGPWKPWEIQDSCSASEYCDPGDPTCNNVPPVQDCTPGSGPCCDGAGFYQPAGFVCQNDADSQYGCPWGTSPGDDVGARYRDRTCPGNSTQCTGAYAPWEAWQTIDSCSLAEVCVPGDPTCNPAGCLATDFWTPTSTSNVTWDALAVQQLDFQKEEVSGNQIRARLCKVGGGNFINNIHLDYEEWAKYSGLFMYSNTLTINPAVPNCTNWAYLDTSSWNEGENIGAQVRVVSPNTCEGLWDDQCTVDPGCGNCWYWLSDTVMQRTCL